MAEKTKVEFLNEVSTVSVAHQSSMDDRIRGFFDWTAAPYGSQYHADTQGGHALRARMDRVLELFDQPGGIVLDLGCGPGETLRVLDKLGCKAYGVDLSSAMLMSARRVSASSRLAISNAQILPFRSGCFDAVVAMGVIEFLPDMQQGFSEMIRVLRPGGTLIASFPNKYSPYAWWRTYVFYRTVAFLRPAYYWLRARKPLPYLAWSNHRLFSERSACELFTMAGCEVEAVAGYNFQMFLSPFEDLFARVSLPLARRFETLCYGRFRWLGSGMVIKARKYRRS